MPGISTDPIDLTTPPNEPIDLTTPPNEPIDLTQSTTPVAPAPAPKEPESLGAKGKRYLERYHNALANPNHVDTTHSAGDYGPLSLVVGEDGKNDPTIQSLRRTFEALKFPEKDNYIFLSFANPEITAAYTNSANTEKGIIVCKLDFSYRDPITPKAPFSDLMFRMWSEACAVSGKLIHSLRAVIIEEILNVTTMNVLKKWYAAWKLPETLTHLWTYDPTGENEEGNQAFEELAGTANVKSSFFMLADHKNAFAHDGKFLSVSGIITNCDAQWLIILIE